MKKWLPNIAGIVLGLLFLMASVMFFLNLGPKPTFPEGSPISHFFAAFGPTGYLKFVKVFELIGGLLVMIPRLRNFGLLLLGPVIVNILAYHLLVDDPMGILNIKYMWMLYIIIASALYLLWAGRKKFASLLG
jgi:putative oxidoreductase